MTNFYKELAAELLESQEACIHPDVVQDDNGIDVCIVCGKELYREENYGD